VRVLLLISLAALSFFARADWARLDAPGNRLNFDAYSVQAPMDPGWIVSRGGAYDVGFAAAFTRTHTWSMTAAAIPLAGRFERAEALLEYVKAKFAGDSDPVRFRIVESKGWVQDLRGAVCAKTYFKAEDHLAEGGEAAYYVIETTLLTCVHPNAPDLAIELGYHERYLPGEESGRLMVVGERFTRSVKFWRPADGHIARAAR
jgi:hypothetical protein